MSSDQQADPGQAASGEPTAAPSGPSGPGTEPAAPSEPRVLREPAFLAEPSSLAPDAGRTDAGWTAPTDPGRPAAAGIKAFWTHPAIVVGAVGVMLLMVTTLAVLALRRDGNTAPQSVADDSASVSGPSGPLLPMSPGAPASGGSQPNPGSQPGQVGNDGRPSQAAPSKEGSRPGTRTTAPAPVLHSGTIGLTVDDAADLDAGKETTDEAVADVIVRKQSLRSGDSGRFAVWSGGGVPSQAQCAAVPASSWVNNVGAEAVADGLSLCVRTTAGRPGGLAFTAVGKDKKKLASVTFRYTVWRS